MDSDNALSDLPPEPEGGAGTITAPGQDPQMAVIATNHDTFTKMVKAVDSFSVEVCAVPTVGLDRSATWRRYCIQATDKSTWEIT